MFRFTMQQEKSTHRYREEKETFKLIPGDTLKAYVAEKESEAMASDTACPIEIVEIELREGSFLLYDRGLAYCKNTVILGAERKQKTKASCKNYSATRPDGSPRRNKNETACQEKTLSEKPKYQRIALFTICHTPYHHVKVNVINNTIKHIFLNMTTGMYGKISKRGGASLSMFAVSPSRSGQKACLVEDQILKYMKMLFPPITKDPGIRELSGVEFFARVTRRPTGLVETLLAAYDKHYRGNETMTFVATVIRLRNEAKKSNAFFRKMNSQKAKSANLLAARKRTTGYRDRMPVNTCDIATFSVKMAMKRRASRRMKVAIPRGKRTLEILRRREDMAEEAVSEISAVV